MRTYRYRTAAVRHYGTQLASVCSPNLKWSVEHYLIFRVPASSSLPLALADTPRRSPWFLVDKCTTRP